MGPTDTGSPPWAGAVLREIAMLTAKLRDIDTGDRLRPHQPRKSRSTALPEGIAGNLSQKEIRIEVISESVKQNTGLPAKEFEIRKSENLNMPSLHKRKEPGVIARLFGFNFRLQTSTQAAFIVPSIVLDGAAPLIAILRGFFSSTRALEVGAEAVLELGAARFNVLGGWRKLRSKARRCPDRGSTAQASSLPVTVSAVVHLDAEVLVGETGHCDRDPVVVLVVRSMLWG
jgi:hypothetical protein